MSEKMSENKVQKKIAEFIEQLVEIYTGCVPQIEVVGNFVYVRRIGEDNNLIESVFDLDQGIRSIINDILKDPSPQVNPPEPPTPTVPSRWILRNPYKGPKYTVDIRGNRAVICSYNSRGLGSVVRQRTIGARKEEDVIAELKSYIADDGETLLPATKNNRIVLDEKNYISIGKSMVYLRSVEYGNISRSISARRNVDKAIELCRQTYVARKLAKIRPSLAVRMIQKNYRITCLYDTQYKIAREKAEKFFADFVE